MSGLPDWKMMDRTAFAERLASLCNSGFSAAKISFQFANCPSASAVCGAVYRLRQKGVKIALAGDWGGPQARAAAGSAKNPSKPKPASAATAQPRTPTPISAKQGRKSGAPGGIPSQSLKRARDTKLNSANITDKAESRKVDPGLPVTITASAAWDALPGVEPITLEQLNSSTCRWPLWEEPGDPRLFCGAECEVERSFCRSHRALAYYPATVRQRASLRSAERIK